MFILDGRPLAPDTAFTHEGIQYPANFLRLASPQERAAIGITEEPDPAFYDQRFYWGPDLPKDHAQLVEQWTQQTRTTAGTLLAPSDWLVIRELDNGTVVPDAWRTWRESIRTATGEKVAAIEQTADTDVLAAYITGADYSAWPLDPNAPASPAPADGLEPAGN
jgi:hypothetical protein